MPFNTLPSGSRDAGAIRPPVELKGVPVTAIDISLGGVNAEQIVKTFSSTDVWEVIDSTLGSGVLSFCAVEQNANASNRSIDARLVIDGLTVWTKVAGWTTSGDNSKGIVPVGNKDTAADSGVTFGYVRFNKGWSLQVRATTASGSVSMNGFTRSQKF